MYVNNFKRQMFRQDIKSHYFINKTISYVENLQPVSLILGVGA